MRALEPLVGLLTNGTLDMPSLGSVRRVFDAAKLSGTSPAKLDLLREAVEARRGEWAGRVERDWTERLKGAKPSVKTPLRIDTASVAPEDLTSSTKTMILPMEKATDWHAPDLVLLAKRYGIKMVLQIGPSVVLGDLVKELVEKTGLSHRELVEVVDVVRSRGALANWGEDRQLVSGSTRPTFMVPSAVGRNTIRRARRYTSKDSSHAIDHLFHGRVAVRKEGAHARGLARILGRPVRSMKSYIEGGNLLSGTTSDGRAYALLGMDSLILSAFDLDRDRAFTRREIAAAEARLEREGAFTKEAVRAVSTRLTMARTGKWLDPKEPSQEKAEDARRFMSVLELTKRAIADDLRLSPSRLVMLTQPGFHIDMHMHPLAPGEVLVHHPKVALEMVERALADRDATDWQKRELEQMKQELLREQKKKGHLYDQILDEVREAGLIAIPAPGVFRSKKRRANFMNAIPGTAPDGRTYYITNGTSIAPLERQAEKFFRSLGVDAVHFVGSGGGSERKLCLAERSLALEGGLDCREVHHGGVDRAPNDLLRDFLRRGRSEA